VHRHERAEQLDFLGRQPELLLRLAQGGRGQVRVLLVRQTTRERDLPRVTREVFGPPGEDEPVALDQRQQHRGEPVARASRGRGAGIEATLQARAHVAPVHSPPW
jgi:hypothetical protein